MNIRTQAIIGVTLVLIGAGVVALGYIGQEQTVRQVWDVMREPEAHTKGSFILIGIPQPERLKDIDGERPNSAHVNETRFVTGWHDGNTAWQSSHIIHVERTGGASHWTYRNETQVPGRPETRFVAETMDWTITRPHTVFLIEGFKDASGTIPRMWGIYEGTFNGVIQPKPSQFEGHLAMEVAGVSLPQGAFVFHVDVFTAGCSSKFLPDDHEVT